MISLYQSPWKLLLLSTLLSAAAAQIGIPTSLSIDYDLSQKHVRVSRTRVAQQFITDIQNIALATIQNSYPDKHIEVINRPSGPTLQWKDITLALEEVWITTADEKKSSGFVRKQKDKAAGYARFSVREHWSGMPTSAGVHHNLKEYSQFVAGFEQRFSQLVDSAPGAAFYVPCKIIPGKKCPEDEKDSGPWGPSWPVGYVVEV